MIEEIMEGRGGVALLTRRFPVDDPKGAAVILHGYGDHMGRYSNLVRLLTGLGLSCYLYDQRGHGRSGGARGAILSWDDYLDDLAHFLEMVTRWHGAPPRVMLGHSMGGLVAASYVLQRPHPVELLVLSSPLFALAVEAGGIKLALARLASRYTPGFSLPTEIKPEMLTHDPAVAEDYANDPLSHKVVNTRWFTEHVEARGLCLEKASLLAVKSLLVVFGTDDPLVDSNGARRFFEAVQVKDRTCIPYAGLYHEIFNEIGKEGPMDDLRAWLASRLPGGEGTAKTDLEV